MQSKKEIKIVTRNKMHNNGTIYKECQINVEPYTGSTRTRSMSSYIQGVPVPDQCGAIYREYQINVQGYEVDMFMKAG